MRFKKIFASVWVILSEIVCLLISILWYMQAKDFEPAISIIVFLAALITSLFLREFEAEKPQESVSDEFSKDIINLSRKENSYGHIKVAYKSEGDNITVKNDIVSRDFEGLNRAAISLEDFLALKKNKELTPLQKTTKINNFMGKVVIWRGNVNSVTLITESDPKSKIALFIVSEFDKEYPPDTFMVIFNHEHSNDLLELSKNDWVEVQGKLTPNRTDFFTLQDSIIINYKKRIK